MPNCLIVDDSIFTRKLLRDLVTALGHKVVAEAGDVQPAIKAFHDVSPDLVTLDIVLPSGTGVDILKAIRQTDRRAKIIVVTASGQPGLDKQVLDLGADAVLHKPFTAAEFRAKMLTMGAAGRGASSGGAKTGSMMLNKQSIVDTALEHAAGVVDFGEDPSFWEGFERLLQSASADAPAGEKASMNIAYSITTLLINRLLIQDFVKRNPPVRAISIKRPLAFVGLSLSGDWELHQLLASDPLARAFALYELAVPCVPPSMRVDGGDRRKSIAKEFFALEELLDQGIRRLRAEKPLELEKPNLCSWLMANSFMSRYVPLQNRRPSYREWLRKADMKPAYRYFKLQLQVLLAQKPCPRDGHVLLHDMANHTYDLETLLATFPDACIVHTHREPSAAIADWCRRVEHWRAVHSQVDLFEVGRLVMDDATERLERCLEARKRLDASRIVDVHYDEVLRDPAGVVKRIHERFGYPLSAELAKQAAASVRTAPPNKPGMLERYGISRQDIERRLGAYAARFELKV